MKNTLLIALFCLFTHLTYSQDEEFPKVVEGGYTSIENNEEQTKPSFPGGVKGFYQYVTDNFKPVKKNKGTHKLKIAFVVEKDGSVTNVKVVQGLDEESDQRLIEVIQNSPKWSPGIQKGKPVRSSFSLPITINYK